MALNWLKFIKVFKSAFREKTTYSSSSSLCWSKHLKATNTEATEARTEGKSELRICLQGFVLLEQRCPTNVYVCP